MFSALKILVCVASVYATTASTDGRYERSDLSNLRPSLPYQWQLSNSWENRRIPSDLGSNLNILGVDSYNQNLNGRNYQGGQLDSAPQSVREYNIQQSPLRGSPQGENSGKQPTNERYIEGQQRGNGYSGLGTYSIVSSSDVGEGSWGRQNGQRQSQFSEGLRNYQNLQIARNNLFIPSLSAKQVPFLGINADDNQEQIPEILGQTRNTFNNEDLNSERVGIIGSGQLIGYNKNLLAQRQSQSEDIQANPSVPQFIQLNNGINSGFLKNQWLGQTSRGNILQGLPNNFEVGQQVEATQNNIKGRYPSQTSPSEGNRDSPLQLQSWRNSNQVGLNQLRDIQRGIAGNDVGNQQFLYSEENQKGLLPTRNEPGINTASLQEVEEGKNQDLRNNFGTSLNSQGERNQNNVAQLQPNIYTYSELSAKILKVIQSNPSMISNMNGLMEQLSSNEDSGNQQVRQLKSLLQEIGKYNRNPWSSGTRLDGQKQQNPLIRNLMEVMDRNAIKQNESNIPISYQSFSTWSS